MDQHKSKVLRRLKIECSSTEEELSYVNKIFELALPLFVEEVNDYCRINHSSNPLNDINETKNKEDTDEFGAGFYSVFRKIVSKSHPDKTDGSRIDSYIDATSAKKQKNISKLVSISKDLNIDLNNLSYQDISDIETSIKRVQAKIKTIKSSYPYTWFFLSKPQKAELVKDFLKKSSLN